MLLFITRILFTAVWKGQYNALSFRSNMNKRHSFFFSFNQFLPPLSLTTFDSLLVLICTILLGSIRLRVWVQCFWLPGLAVYSEPHSSHGAGLLAHLQCPGLLLAARDRPRCAGHCVAAEGAAWSGPQRLCDRVVHLCRNKVNISCYLFAIEGYCIV